MLSAPTSPVAVAYAALAADVLTAYYGLSQMTSKDLRSELQADLLADLAPPDIVAASETPSEPLPPELTEATPALSVHWTPLRWSRPKVVRAAGGAGKAVKLGPLKVELSVKE